MLMTDTHTGACQVASGVEKFSNVVRWKRLTGGLKNVITSI